MLSSIQKLTPAGQDVAVAQYGDDSGLYAEFYWRPVQNEKKSLEAGYPVYEDKEYIKIIAIGDKTKAWDRPVRKLPAGNVPADTDRFARQYQAFLNQQKQSQEGMPIEEWAGITRADAAMLKAQNIHTVETLASLQENNLAAFLGARQLRDRAKAWLEKAKDGAASAQWAKEKADMQAQLEAMQNQINGFRAAGVPLQEASAPPAPKKRGPKPKVKDEQDIPTTNAGGG